MRYTAHRNVSYKNNIITIILFLPSSCSGRITEPTPIPPPAPNLLLLGLGCGKIPLQEFSYLTPSTFSPTLGQEQPHLLFSLLSHFLSHSSLYSSPLPISLQTEEESIGLTHVFIHSFIPNILSSYHMPALLQALRIQQ